MVRDGEEEDGGREGGREGGEWYFGIREKKE